MKPKLLDIKFDNPHGVFTAGTSVSGNILLGLEQTLKIKGIKILFVGQAKTYWTRQQGRNKVSYNGLETYFYTYIKLFGPGPESTRELPVGNHAFPFSFQLAESLPSSFEGTRGHVRYSCKVTIERPWAFDSHVKRAFTVLHHLDLKTIPSASIPISCRETGEVYGCCGNAGSVDIQLDLNKAGYVPGEPIIYTISVHNRSTKTVNQVGLILKQISTYTGISNALWSSGNPKLHPKTRQFYLLYSRDCSFKPDSSKVIHNSIAVPSLPPSQLDGCTIIDIKYTIELKVLCGLSISIEKDIIIGTIPTQLPDAQLTSAIQALPSAPVVPKPLSVEAGDLPTYEEALAPPPSYAECVYGRTTIMDTEDDTNTGGDNSWVPSYPFYNFAGSSGQQLEEMSAGLEIHEDGD